MAEHRDPWAEIRARPGMWAYAIQRVIDLEAGTDRFRIVRPRQADTRAQLLAGETAEAKDGTTVILPEAERNDAEIAEIIATHDERWRERQVLDEPA